MKWWIPWIIPFGIQLPCLCVQLLLMRKSLKIDKQRNERIPFWLAENSQLWHINRLMVEWIRVKHPESYEEFVAACLDEEDFKLLQVVGEEAFYEGQNCN